MEPPPLLPEPQTEPPRTATMSVGARLMNVFAVPGEVFQEVKVAPASAANWVVPVLLFIIVGVLSVLVIFSQPAIVQQLREQQDKAIEKQVQAGKITQAQADQATAVLEKFMGPTTLKLFGSAGVVVVGFVRVLWWAFILWLFGRWVLKVSLDFNKTLEVAGLTTMIVVLGAVVALLLTVNLGKLGMGASLALAVKDFDMNRKSHLFAGAANVFSFWQLAVTSIGLARLANVPFVRAAWVVFTYWLMQESLLIMSGMGQWAL
ncbi:MAG TPA: YIP1 family protein [Candidatus Binatia bacterium]|jgi:hypothetical protein|nr:YIP1 family protein [Candidatus Binatia bacterium]